MPAEGAMVTRLEAPVQEPLDVVREGEVRLAGVTKSFDGRDGRGVALERLDLRGRAGEVVGVGGPSGWGKSTLLDLVCGRAAPAEGTVGAGDAVLMPQK